MPILRIERGGQGMTFTLRYRLAHVIEVAARHFGHLDLLARCSAARGEVVRASSDAILKPELPVAQMPTCAG